MRTTQSHSSWNGSAASVTAKGTGSRRANRRLDDRHEVVTGSPWKLVELCAGSAALTYHLLGARGYQITPYQGSKWPVRHLIAEHLAAAGFVGPPATVELVDPSFWGVAHRCILDPRRRARVIAHLRDLDTRDPRDVYDSLHKHEIDPRPEVATAEFLFLQRLAFSGKSVGTKGGRWKSQGFNKSSAYGTAGTDKFHEVKPLVASLVRTLGKLELTPAEHVVRRDVARPPVGFQFRTVAYIDGPYQGTTPYPDGHMSRAELVELAEAWRAAGAYVVISEGGPVEMPSRGWSACRIKMLQPRMQGAKERPRKPREEWLTFSR